jgi:hypothetical protein
LVFPEPEEFGLEPELPGRSVFSGLVDGRSEFELFGLSDGLVLLPGLSVGRVLLGLSVGRVLLGGRDSPLPLPGGRLPPFPGGRCPGLGLLPGGGLCPGLGLKGGRTPGVITIYSGGGG